MTSDERGDEVDKSKAPRMSSTRRCVPDKLSWDSFRLLVAVADAGSFRSAAGIAGVALNTMRSKLDHLERQFATPLFKRGVAGVTLTPAGLRLAVVARQMKALVNSANTIGDGNDSHA